MKLLLFLLLVLCSIDSLAQCTGSPYCTVCTNCSRCRYCRGGGTCGVCGGGAPRSSRHRTSHRTPSYSSQNIPLYNENDNRAFPKKRSSGKRPKDNHSYIISEPSPPKDSTVPPPYYSTSSGTTEKESANGLVVFLIILLIIVVGLNLKRK